MPCAASPLADSVTLILTTWASLGSDSSSTVLPDRVPVKRTRFTKPSQSKHRPKGESTALTDPVEALNAPSSATRGALDPYSGKMINPKGLIVFEGAPMNPSSLKLQFWPDASIRISR